MGIVARPDVVLSAWELRRKLETGAWEHMFPGIYWDGPKSPPFDAWADAALKWAGREAVLAGQSAAAQQSSMERGYKPPSP